MPRKHPDFTHRDKFTTYMREALRLIPDADGSQSALDVPAGAGHFGDALAQKGYKVTCADINRDRPDFVAADLNKTLPFDDASFDLVTCLEGIEHILDPFHLIGELARVVKPGGQIVLSTPNVMNMHSRVSFLLTGTLYHHAPKNATRIELGQPRDPGHISPVSYHQLRYIAQHHSLEITAVATDRFKKKMLLPLWLLVYPLGRLWARGMILAPPDREDHAALRRAYEHTFSMAILFGRTMIVSMCKGQNCKTS